MLGGVDAAWVKAAVSCPLPGVTVVSTGAEGAAPTDQLTWAGPPEGFVVNVFLVFQNSFICVGPAGPSVQAMPMLYVPGGMFPGENTA